MSKLKKVYIYEREGVPILDTCYDCYSNTTISSRGLNGLAEDLISCLHLNFGRNLNGLVLEINFHSAFPHLFHTDPLSLDNQRTFEKLLPEEIMIKWINNHPLRN